MNLEPIKLPADAHRDGKKIARFLETVEQALNKLIAGAKQQTKITARELVARPTYAEEFDNLRDNLNPKVMQDYSGIDDFDARSSMQTNQGAHKRGKKQEERLPLKERTE